MLETMTQLTHERCATAVELGGWFDGHGSVTELEICADTFEYIENARFEHSMAAEQYNEFD